MKNYMDLFSLQHVARHLIHPPHPHPPKFIKSTREAKKVVCLKSPHFPPKIIISMRETNKVVCLYWPQSFSFPPKKIIKITVQEKQRRSSAYVGLNPSHPLPKRLLEVRYKKNKEGRLRMLASILLPPPTQIIERTR